MKVIRKIGVAVLTLALGIVIGLVGLVGTQTVRYMNRGFEFKKAATWALDDVTRFKDNTGFVGMCLGIGFKQDQLVKHSYPMANANITWDLLWKKP